MATNPQDSWPREKNWKMMYTRQCKLKRAEQLRINYPRGRSTPPFEEMHKYNHALRPNVAAASTHGLSIHDDA
jgi:hypothetical protein